MTDPMTNQSATLIDFYKADGGFMVELLDFLGHLVGARQCSLCGITHSPIKKKNSFQAYEAKLLRERGITMRLIHMNERTEVELATSKGR